MSDVSFLRRYTSVNVFLFMNYLNIFIMKHEGLTDADYHVFSILLCVEINKLKRFYKCHGIDGLCLIAISNDYFRTCGFIARNIANIRRIADIYDHVNGRSIVDDMFRHKILVRCGKMCYVRNFFVCNGLNIKDVDHYLTHHKKEHDGMEKDFLNLKINNRNYMYDVIGRLHERINSELPEHICSRLEGMGHKVYNINSECCFRVLNFYFSLNSGFIGFKRLVDVLLPLFHLSLSDFVKFIRLTDIIKIEDDRGILYDAVQRMEHGMTPSPSNYEVKHARMVFKERINNCFILN